MGYDLAFFHASTDCTGLGIFENSVENKSLNLGTVQWNELGRILFFYFNFCPLSWLWFRSMQGNPRQSWILDSTSWIPDSSLPQCNLNSEFQSLVGFRIPWAGFQIPWAGFWMYKAWFRIPLAGFRIPWAGFPTPWAGFRIPWAGFRILWGAFRVLRYRIPDATSKNFPVFGIPIPVIAAIWFELALIHLEKPDKKCYFKKKSICMKCYQYLLNYRR